MITNQNKIKEIKFRKQKIQLKIDILKQQLQKVIDQGNKDFDIDTMQESAKRKNKTQR